MSAMQRRKGQAAERELCKLIRDELGDAVARNLDQTRDGGGDIALRHMLIEVKHHAKPSIKSWWQQCVASAKAAGKLPVLAYKINRKGWRVRMPLPQAWATENVWREHISYTMELDLNGFWLVCREDHGFSEGKA